MLTSILNLLFVGEGFDIKFIICGGGLITVASPCHWGPRASLRRCTAARAWRTQPK
ncbi:Os07g0593100 [Oryza sativa Japonica Group]|uniref:Os07g0593100 protein n=1 Tax=Oryza sativa subsp. japonica TaxID=39947 RepID=A0A0P0X936_ORYSJ|nr:hypothetical protein DAI22_07g214200 [Oryza sativa Japonica Group]BAT02455.1 Os07g0593100 [Oryza sativa Japonica Group]